MRNEVSKIESSTTEAVNIYSNSVLETFKALVDDAFRDAPLSPRQKKATAILSEAHKHLSGDHGLAPFSTKFDTEQ